MFDLINGGSENEDPQVILNRYQSEMKAENSKYSILTVCQLTFGLVRSWPSFAPYTHHRNPYEFLGDTTDIPEGTARVYFQIGNVMNRYEDALKDTDLEVIASPYMLKDLPKAFDNHKDSNDVIHALKTMSVRKFTEYANTRDRPAKTLKASTGTKENKAPAVSLYRPQLREAFDADREVFIVGVTSQEQWEAIKESLLRSTMHVVPNSPEMSSEALTVLPEDAVI